MTHKINTKLALDGQSHDYLYALISRRLRAEIEEGVYAEGSRLPSLDEMGRRYSVNRLTVRRAIQELKQSGLVYSMPAKGTYVAMRANAQGGRVARSPWKRGARVIGLLSRVMVPNEYGYYHRDVLSGIQEILNANGDNLLILAAGSAAESNYASMIDEANVDAMIYLGSFDDGILRALLREGPVAVAVDSNITNLPCDSILVDNVAIGRLAAEILAGKEMLSGCAVIAGSPTDRASDDRVKGFMDVAKAHGVKESGIRQIPGMFTIEGGFEACRRILEDGNPPRAIFCLNDEMAAGAYKALSGAGLSIPSDVSILGCDDIILAQTLNPKLSTFRIDTRQMGRLAARMLRERLDSPKGAFSCTTLQPSLVMRGSLAR